MKLPNEFPCPYPRCRSEIGDPCTEIDSSGERHPMQGFHAERVMLAKSEEEG